MPTGGYFFAIACFFITGEEISWGERLGGLSIEAISSINTQGETNIHNLEIVTKNIRHSAFVVTGFFLGLGQRLFPNVSVLPVERFTLFFLIPGLWYLIYTFGNPYCSYCIPDQEELYELILALGFAIHAVSCLRSVHG
jgi:hypothetical protein